MRKTYLKTLAMVLGIVILLSALPLSVFAEDLSGTCGDNLTWTFDAETGVLDITGTGEMTNWDSDSTVPWHYSWENIKTVNIANDVTTIGDYAFYACSNLTSVTVTDSVMAIGDYAFSACSNLTNIIIPDNVTTIGDFAFAQCTSLTSITIPDSVTTIGDYAFLACIGLTSITIPDSVVSIGSRIFRKCSSLTNITVNEGNTVYSSDEYGVLFNKDKTQLIQYPIGNERTSYTISDSVTTISDYAFAECLNLASVTIGNSVTTIDDLAFFGCTGITNVTISDSVTTIDYGAFAKCSSLMSITIPDSVVEICDNAFEQCTSLASVTIGNGVTTIGKAAFLACSRLESVTIGNGVTTIGDFAFAQCTSLASITIPDSVTTIGESAFYDGRALEYIHIPTGVNEIGETLLYSDSSTYICSTTQDCYAKTYADENGIEFRLCTGHGTDEPVYIEKTSDNGIKVEYDSSYFDNNDEIKLVAKVVNYSDSNFAKHNEKGTAIEHYDIHLEYKNGDSVEYDKSLTEFTVKIPVPSGYEHYVKFLITHWITDVNGKETCETLNGIVEDGYIVFKTKSFSEFDVCLFGFAQESLELTYKSTASFDVIKGTGFMVTYTSSNPKVVTVDENGNITTQGRGSATITCTITDDFGNTVSDTCEVTVKFTFWQWIIYILFLGFLWY